MWCLDDAQIDCVGEKSRLKGLSVIIVATVMLASSLLLAAGGTLSQAFAAENAALAPSAVPMAAQSGGTVEFDTVDIASGTGSVVWNAATNTITLKNTSINMGKQSETYQYASYAIHANGQAVSPTPTVTLKLVGNSTITCTREEYMSAAIGIENANLKITGTGTLTITAKESSYGISVDGNLTAASGTVNVTGGACGFRAGGKTVLSGAVLSSKNNEFAGIESTGAVTLSKGSLTVSNATDGIYSYDDVKLSGATVSTTQMSDAAIYAPNGGVAATAGKLVAKKCAYGLSVSKAITMSGKGATVSLNNIEQFGVFSDGLTMKAGKLSVSGCTMGVASFGTLKMTGGTLSVKGATGGAIDVAEGKLKVTGGSVTAKCTTGGFNALSAAKGVSVKAGCLKAAGGVLPKGVTFKSGGNTYVVNDDYAVTLKAYGSSKTKTTVNTLKYGKVTYYVTSIGAKAFATSAGKALKSLTIGGYVTSIGKNAFYGTAKLTKLNVQDFIFGAASLNKKAFAKCGKKSGAKLTVVCPEGAKKHVKKVFVAAGMSKKAKWA